MEHDPLYEIFHFFSRILIFIPIGILIAGIMIRLNQTNKLIISSNESKKAVITQNPSTVAVTPNVQLNLQGPFVCQFSTPDATVSAYIKNKNVSAHIQMKTEISRLLLSNDCVYIWKPTESVGQKICGLSPYISLLGTLPINGLLSGGISSGMMANLNIMPISVPIKAADIASLINSCKKQDVQDMSVFTMPKNVTFKEQKMQ